MSNARIAELLVLATTDPDTGEPTGHLRCPCSRYGRTGEDVAPWAVAFALIHETDDGDDAAAVDWAMGLAVNDSDAVVALVADNWDAVPADLAELLDGDVLADHRADNADDDDLDDDGSDPGPMPGQFTLDFAA